MKSNPIETHDYTVSFIQSMNDMLIVVTPDRRIVSCNPAACRRLQYSQEEMTGLRLDEILHSETSATKSRLETSLESDILREQERSYFTKSGERIPVMFSSAIMRDKHGVNQGLVCVAIDLTERKRAEAIRQKRDEDLQLRNETLGDLARSKDLHSGNLEAATGTITEHAWGALKIDRVSIWLYDANKETLECIDLYGDDPPSHSRGQLLLANDHLAYFDALRAERCIAAHDARRDPRTVSFANEYLKHHDIVSMLDAPIRLAGEVVGVLCLEHKVSIRHWDHETQTFAGSLADLTSLALEARDRKIREESLRQAKEDAAAASWAKSTFLANMSHEIRTPLNGVVGMLKLMRKQPLSEKQKHYADSAIISADTLLSVINDVLDFSKIEAGKLDLDVVDIRVQDIAEDVVGMFAERASVKGLVVGSVVDPAVTNLLKGDRSRLSQILINLVGNAVKFTETGKVVVRCGLKAQTSVQVCLRFEVEDTGAGMSVEECEKIFASFTQGDATTTRIHGGTGLGLAISKQLVELMGGAIGVDSTPGVGSTFWFTVLLDKHEPASPSPGAYIDLRGIRMLIADESDSHREIMRQQVLAWGCDLTETRDANSAETALRQAVKEGCPFQVVVVSKSLPDRDVSSFARSVHDDDRLSDTGLILVSDIDDMDPLAAEDREFRVSLVKPVPQSILYDAIIIAGNAARRKTSSQPGFIDEHSNSTHLPFRILLAEDNEINQELALEILQSAGYRCDCVGSGQDAVNSVFQGMYDLVLMDCQMPVMDGFDASRTIRSREAQRVEPDIVRARIPIVALTANAMKGDRERCIESGMDDYMSKPLDPDRLMEMVRKWLGPVPRSEVCDQAGIKVPDALQCGTAKIERTTNAQE
jgi:PAS domain S-box-containing protein